jgi:hypothetical protein
VALVPALSLPHSPARTDPTTSNAGPNRSLALDKPDIVSDIVPDIRPDIAANITIYSTILFIEPDGFDLELQH